VNISILFQQTLCKSPHHSAIVFGSHSITYQQLDQLSNALANEIVAQGVKQGDLVGIATETRIETIVGVLAIIKVGCAYVPLPDYYPKDRLDMILKHANVSLVIGNVGNLTENKLKVIPYSAFEALADKNSEFAPPDIGPDSVAYVMFTSGSTGKPKGVVVPHRGVTRLVIDQNFMTLDNEQRILQNSPIAFDASTLEIWGALLNGGTLVIPEEKELNLQYLAHIFKEQNITTTWLTAGLFHAMADEYPQAFKPLNQLLTGGDVVSPEKVASVKSVCPDLTIINGYGPTENTTFTCCHTIIAGDLKSGLPLPIGKAINGTETYVLDESLQPVNGVEEGELCVSGKGLALGYLGEEKLTQDVFVTAPWNKSLVLYRTGDLVKQDDKGLYHYIGRLDTQVKIRGFRIELGEVENKIENFTGVQQAVVIAKSSADGADKRLLAFYRAESTIDHQQLKVYLEQQLADYSVPSRFTRLESIPLNANGKVDRKALLNINVAPVSKATQTDNNISGIESFLVKNLQDILGTQQIDVSTQFFDLGASSLHIARLHSRLEKHLNKTIPITDLFLHSTVIKLFTHLSSRHTKDSQPSPPTKNHTNVVNGKIAIIGMSGRFPGAKNISEFWDALVNERELITHFSDEEREITIADHDADQPYVNARGILQDSDHFDAEHFGITPKEAENLDPQHRILLEVAQEALEDAGVNPENYGGKIGVFSGNSQNSYLLNNLVSAPGAARQFAAGYPVKDFSMLFGNDKDFNVTRVAYKLNLTGPAVNVQCACSTSLVAVAQACDSLKQGTADVALAGGVSITFPQKRPYLYTPDGMASSDGHCRSFDADATGTVFGDGAGLVVLKRLDDAIADGDDIVAVIEGYSINNDGSDKIGYAAPSIKAQSEVIQAAHKNANVDPRSISYIEAHGTGTPLGDPIEFAALHDAFSSRTSDKNFCAIGTAKTNVGHLDIAAGITGLIKTATSLKKRIIPPLLHYTAPNANIDFKNSAFYPVTELTQWKADDNVIRRAGISAFGVGGTNIHMILAEPPITIEKLQAQSEAQGLQVFPVSASTPAALEQSIRNLGDWATSKPHENIDALLHTLRYRRRYFDYRTTLAADSLEQLATVANAHTGKAIKVGQRYKLVMLLPGQGSQHMGMAHSLYEQELIFREAFERCAQILEPHLTLNLSELIFADCSPETQQAKSIAEQLKDTRIAQPAIFAIEYALVKQWQHWGIEPGILLGHSIGELAAACIANVIDLNDALHIIALRGRLMSDLPKGNMVSVRASKEEVLPYLNEGMDLAAVNGAKACVVAGSEEATQKIEAKFNQDGIVFSHLHTSHAFHSRMMDPIVDEFKKAIAALTLRAPQIPIFSTVSGSWLTDEQAIDPAYWAGHMRSPVQFFEGLQYFWKNEPQCVFLEVGPGKTLSTLAGQNPDRKNNQPAFATLPHAKDVDQDAKTTMLETLGQLWASGYRVDWERLSPKPVAVTQHSKLPAYPFQRKRFWVEPADIDATEQQPKIVNDTASQTDENNDSDVSLIDALKNMLSELSGFDTDDMQTDQSFLDMGFDSLLLTQAIKELSNGFGVAVKLRELIDGYDTIDSLASYIEQNGHYSGGLSPTMPKLENTLVRAAAKASTSLSSAPTTRVERSDNSDELKPRQRQHIDDLVKRFNAKTPQSKALTDQYRQYHADPRTASGFNRLWKELVYQIVTVKSKGSRLIDIDGNEYIDILNGFGPGFLGHGVDHVLESLHKQVDTGFEVGPQSLIAMEAAQLFCELTGNERASFVCTGSEAVYAAMRLARTCTSRDKIVMFARDYHGNFDEVLVRGIDGKNGPRTMPLAPGIPKEAVSNVIVLPYGTPQALDYVRQNVHMLAAVIVEPVQSRRPEFQPYEFIREVRRITQNAGTLFIFDEVVTGFRFGPRGAQAFYGVDADLVTYGKVIGGGMPLGVVSGKSEFMDTFDGGQWQFGDDSFPQAPVTFFAGTFVRHPLVMASLKSMLEFFKAQPAHFWKAVNAKGNKLAGNIDRWFAENDMPFAMPNCGSLMYLRINEDQKYGALLGAHMRDRGVFILEGFPSYMTAAHDDEDIDYVIDAFKDSALEMRAAGMLTGRDTLEEQSYTAKVQVVPPRLSLPGGEEKISQQMKEPLSAPLIPMTDAQKEIWLAVQIGGESANIAYNESINLTFSDVIKTDVLEQALNILVERHEALRLRVSSDGQSIVFRETLKLPLTLVDLSTQASTALDDFIDTQMHQPFKLEDDVLVRANFVKLPDQISQLVLTLHHIICDGWSFGILLTELSELYSSMVSDQGHADLVPPDSYEKYALQEQLQNTGNAFKNDLDYWLAQHTPVVSELDLPLDYPRPAQRTYDAERIDITIDSELTQKLRALAKQTKTSFFALSYAAFCAYIARLAQRDDFVIGVPYAGQLASGMMNLVGHCVNVLPLRVKTLQEQSFADFLQTVNQQLLEGFDHPNITMGSLVSALHINRDASRIPLIPITFNFDKTLGELSFDSQVAEFSSNARLAEPFELALNLEDKGDTLLAQWSFNRQLFSRQTMQYRAQAFVELLEAISEASNSLLSELPIVSNQEKILFEQFNSKQNEPESLLPVTHWFKQSVQQFPEATAIEFDRKILSYQQAAQRTDQICGLLAEAGVRSGDIVALYLNRSSDLPLAMLAVMQMACAYIPLDPHQPEERIAAIVSDAGAKYVLANSEVPAKIAAGNQNILQLASVDEQVIAQWDRRQFSEPTCDDIAYIIYTSGSTGKPKGVAVKHIGLSNIVRSFQSTPGFSTDDRLLAVTTASFDIAGLELFLPLSIGATVVVAKENTVHDPQKLSELLNKKNITVLQCVPTTWQLLLTYGGALPANLRGWCGGEALPAELAKTATSQIELWNVYGPTETTIWSTIHRVIFENITDNKPVSIGQAIDNTTLYILDKNFNTVPIGVPGTLWIGGSGVAAHYHQRPELTEEKFKVNPFLDDKNAPVLYDTGDLVRMTNSGSLEYLGREDFQVKIRGFRIELGEIESVLLRHDNVDACVVVAQKDPQGRELIVTYFVSNIKIEQTDVFNSHLAVTLPEYMIPNLFIQLDELPLNTNGKVDRKQLPRLGKIQTLSSSKAPIAPQNDIEIIVLKLFEKYLHRTAMSMADNFFEMGGDSLAAVQLVVELNETLSINLPMAVLLQAPTSRALTNMVRSGEEHFSIKPVIHLRQEKNGIPVFCLMGINVYAELAKLLGKGFSVYGLLSKQENDFLKDIFKDKKSAQSIINIQSIADEYAQLILELNLESPYYLLGYSSGGVVSIEVAKRLQAAGKEVALVGLLDTILPRGVKRSYRKVLKSGAKLLSKYGQRLLVLSTDEKSKQEVKTQSDTQLYNHDLAGLRGDLLWQSIVSWDDTNASYKGDVVLFEALELTEMGSLDLQKGLGWKELLQKKLKIIDVPGNHSDLLRGESVKVIAENLNKLILKS